MARQSIAPNDRWLKSPIDSEECSSKSHLVNYLIRQAREWQSEIDWIRVKLNRAEKEDSQLKRVRKYFLNQKRV